MFAEPKVSQAGGSRDESSGEATKAEGFVTLEIPVDGVGSVWTRRIRLSMWG